MTERDEESSRSAIMQATYRALADRGYADLTTQAIAEESGTSTALLHYHFDTKEELLVEFLAYLLDRFRQNVTIDEEDPTAQLRSMPKKFLSGPPDDEAFHTAMVDLRAQAAHNEAYREQLRINDAELRGVLASVIERGIEAGEFHDVDADRVATYIVSTLEGARNRWVVLGEDAILEAVEAELLAYLEARLFRDAEDE